MDVSWSPQLYEYDESANCLKTSLEEYLEATTDASFYVTEL